MIKRALTAIAAGAAFLLCGCPGPTFVVQQYAGPQRPGYTIAVLRVNGNEPVRLLVLDEKDVAAPVLEDGRLHIEILPARHTLVAGRVGNDVTRDVAFVAEAGRVYRVAFVAATPHVYEVDRASDAIVRDVTEGDTSRDTPPASPLPAPAEAP